MNDQQKAKFLQAFIIVPNLTPAERNLLRELSHAFATGTAASWGAANPLHRQSVHDLFEKLKCLMQSHTK